MYHTIYPFKVYNLVFHIFTELCGDHHCLILKYIHCPKKKRYTHGHPSFPPTPILLLPAPGNH